MILFVWVSIALATIGGLIGYIYAPPHIQEIFMFFSILVSCTTSFAAIATWTYTYAKFEPAFEVSEAVQEEKLKETEGKPDKKQIEKANT